MRETEGGRWTWWDKDKNICFDGYIGTWILWIYQRYIGGYYYINIHKTNENYIKL